MNLDIRVGDLILLDQLVDLTECRAHTFNLRSANMTEPFCRQMRQTVLETARRQGVAIHERASYLPVFQGAAL